MNGNTMAIESRFWYPVYPVDSPELPHSKSKDKDGNRANREQTRIRENSGKEGNPHNGSQDPQKIGKARVKGSPGCHSGAGDLVDEISREHHQSHAQNLQGRRDLNAQLIAHPDGSKNHYQSTTNRKNGIAKQGRPQQS